MKHTTPPPPASKSIAPIAMKPRRGLFVALMITFLVWIALVLTMYFTTVYHKTDVHEDRPTTQQSLK
jgi:hypothetical protein